MKPSGTSSSVGAACLFVLSLVVAVGIVPRTLAAETVTGTIFGRVTDATGAGVPGATVTLTQSAMGLVRVTETDSAGDYVGPLLSTGLYTISASQTRFKTIAFANVRLGVDQKVRIDLPLELGAITEFLRVEAFSRLVQTSSSDLSATLTETQVQALPLNGRNFVLLTRTLPGVIRGIPGANIDGSSSLAWRMSASFSANGQRTRDNNFLLDGVDNNESLLNSVVVFPSVDAIEEINVQTSGSWLGSTSPSETGSSRPTTQRNGNTGATT